jgi:hypothetical protein
MTLMDKDQLRIKLDELHITPSNYNLEGKFSDDCVILDYSNHLWHVYVTDERGKYQKDNQFSSEQEACTFIYNSFKSWFNYDLRDLQRIYGLLKKRPHRKNKAFLEQYIFDKLDFDLPPNFKSFYTLYDGAVGYVGKHTYIDIWRLEELEQINNQFNLASLGGFYFFAKSASNQGYSFSKKTPEIFEIQEMSKLETADFRFCGKDIDDFLLCLFDK